MPSGEVGKRFYQKHKERVKQEVHDRKERLKEWYRDYKSALECQTCGENHPACIEFHHRDPARKDINPGQMTTDGWGIERMKKELDKCDVLCANCHRKIHHAGVVSTVA